MEELVSPSWEAGGEQRADEERYQIAVGEEEGKRQIIAVDAVSSVAGSGPRTSADRSSCSACSTTPLPPYSTRLLPSPCLLSLTRTSTDCATPPLARARGRPVSLELVGRSWSVEPDDWVGVSMSRWRGDGSRSREFVRLGRRGGADRPSSLYRVCTSTGSATPRLKELQLVSPSSLTKMAR